MWVQVGHEWVKEPIFYGKEWFLMCRNDVTLTVRTLRMPSEAGLLKRVRRILRENGIAADVVDGEASFRSISTFPPKYDGLKQSASVRLELKALPLPVDLPVHTSIRVDKRPVGEVFNECA